MIGKTTTSTVYGNSSEKTYVEVDIARGIPYFHIIGLTDAVIKESSDRIRSAIINSGYSFPMNRITVNLSPANKRKYGSHYDLSIAVSILKLQGYINIDIEKFAFFGELSLDGNINHVNDLLSLIEIIDESQYIFIPSKNVLETFILKKYRKIIAVDSLKDVIDAIENVESYGDMRKTLKVNNLACLSKDNEFKSKVNRINKMDFSQINGQENVKRAMIISAAGEHNVLLMGAPGIGKSAIAKRFDTILPLLEENEILEVGKIYNKCNRLDEFQNNIIIGKNEKELKALRPVRMPTNNITPCEFIGGGINVKPGEISLAHKGVLILDEVALFDKRCLELLRIALDERQIALKRNELEYVFPADYILICTTNPCKCGYRGDEEHICSCSQQQLDSFMQQLSGPLIDRIDMHIFMYKDNSNINQKNNMSSKEMKKLVIKARNIQKERYKNERVNTNGKLDEKNIKKYIKLSWEAERFLKTAENKLSLSNRAVNSLLKIARTIADIEESELVEVNHISESVQYRNIKELYRSKN